MTKDYANAHEKRARTRKVRALCRAVRELGNKYGAEPAQLSYWIKNAGADVRAAVAQLAKVNTPSASTWARVVHSLHVYRSN